MPADEKALPKILVVDDLPANLLAAQHTLRQLEVEVVTAGSGREALSAVLRHSFALILLDVRMPEMDGYETASLIREHTAAEPVPIIFVTASEREDRKVFQGYEIGAIDYLFKPIEPDLLLAKVRVLLDLHAHRRALADASEHLRLANRQLSSLIDAVDEGIVGLDDVGHVSFANPAACRLLQCSIEQIRGLSLASVVERPEFDHATSAGTQLRLLLRRERTRRVPEAVFKTFRASELPVHYVISQIDALGAGHASYVVVFDDISDRQRAALRLRQQAESDHLTGLANRLLFDGQLQKKIDHHAETGEGFALLYFDLDRFKPINDQYGHAFGDEVLRVVAQRLRHGVRSNDLVARLGGDEFAVVLSNTVDRDVARDAAVELVNSISRPSECGGIKLQVGASVGLAVFPLDGATRESLVSHADQAMYSAKASR
jgi:diguanylate cyclase (GGDEF)-like protein/PAS domain S-box-containing protein